MLTFRLDIGWFSLLWGSRGSGRLITAPVFVLGNAHCKLLSGVVASHFLHIRHGAKPLRLSSGPLVRALYPRRAQGRLPEVPHVAHDIGVDLNRRPAMPALALSAASRAQV